MADFIFDTQDLSTIRGGGLLLLDAPDRLVHSFPQLRPVATGASVGLFRFEPDEGKAPGQLRNEVLDFLRSDNELGHATFVADVLPVPQDPNRFSELREKLRAMNRWQQMRRPSVVVPQAGSGGATGPCPIDGVRPATTTVPHPSPRVATASASVAARREHGRKMKRAFYRRELGASSDPPGFDVSGEATWTLHELTQRGDARAGSSAEGDPRAHLEGKMAVLYLDGNGFGEIGAETCQTEAAQGCWSSTIKENHREVLRALWDRMQAEPEWRVRVPGGRGGDVHELYRIETLLWGGDELILVVPAWKGWETLSLFYEHAAQWSWRSPDAEAEAEPIPLTYSAGLVFCHHKAPIHRIKGLAQQLADAAKSGPAGAPGNRFAYQVLESFDHLGEDFEAERRRQCPPGYAPADLCVDGENMEQIRDCFEALKNGLARGQVYRVVHALQAAGSPDDDSVKRAVDRARSMARDDATRKQLDALPRLVANEPVPWLHLAELWDYVGV
jgi:hypothetical protein